MLVNYALDMKNEPQTISGPIVDNSWQSKDIRLHESDKFKSFYSIYLHSPLAFGSSVFSAPVISFPLTYKTVTNPEL